MKGILAVKAPLEEWKELQDLQERSRKLLEEGRYDEVLQTVQEAIGLEENNIASLRIKAVALRGLGRGEDARQLESRVQQLRKKAWQRQVEAELRGRHEVMGEAIRHEKI